MSELKLTREHFVTAFKEHTFINVDPIMHDCILPDPLNTVIMIELKE